MRALSMLVSCACRAYVRGASVLVMRRFSSPQAGLVAGAVVGVYIAQNYRVSGCTIVSLARLLPPTSVGGVWRAG